MKAMIVQDEGEEYLLSSENLMLCKKVSDGEGQIAPTVPYSMDIIFASEQNRQ